MREHTIAEPLAHRAKSGDKVAERCVFGSKSSQLSEDQLRWFFREFSHTYTAADSGVLWTSLG